MKSKSLCGGPDIYYGLAEPLYNIITNEELENKKNIFLNKLENVDREQLEQKTREQNISQDWLIERKKRLTASHFGEICKMRVNTSCRKKVHNLLYKSGTICKEMNYGIQMEPIARSAFETLHKVSVKLCGLVIDNELPYLAASPGNIFVISNYNYFNNKKQYSIILFLDGLIDTNAIIEIKCPYVAKDSISAIEAINNKLVCIYNIYVGTILYIVQYNEIIILLI